MTNECTLLAYGLENPLRPFVPGLPSLSFMDGTQLMPLADSEKGGSIHICMQARELAEWAALTDGDWIADLMRLCCKKQDSPSKQGMADQVVEMLADLILAGAKAIDREAFARIRHEQAGQMLRVLQADERRQAQVA